MKTGRIALGVAVFAAAQSVAWPGAVALEDVAVRLVGVDSEERYDRLEQRLRNASLSVQALEEEVETPQDILASATADYRRLLSALYSEGHYSPDISILLDGREAAEIDPFMPPQSVRQIEIVVEPNRIFRFGTARVAPRPGAAPREPVVDGFATGETARADLVGAAANAAIGEWREIGHAKAEVAEQSVVATHPVRRLDVEIALDPGPRLRFGEMTIAEGSEVSDARVRSIMGYPEGEVFSPDALADAIARLRRTGVWAVATLAEADVPNPDGTLDYRLTLVDQLKRRFGFSAEYSTLDGALIGGFWLHRNLFGGAERFRIDAEIANIGGQTSGFGDTDGIDYSVEARLTRPATLGPDTDAFVFALAERNDEDDFRETIFSAGVGLSRYFTDRLYGEAATGLRYSEAVDDFGTREFYHVIFPSQLQWDLRDDEGDPTFGAYFDAEVEPFIGIAGSQSGVRALLDNRGYVTPGSRDLVTLAARFQIGSVVGPSLEETPPEFLFFSGGSDTVRGQEFESLGIDDRGIDTGGRSFAGLQLELRGRITDRLGAVAFADAGVVGVDSVIEGDSASHSGFGLGVRYGTPIGPLRLDVATPYTNDDGDVEAFSAVAVYIGVGQAF